jgi:hypothetical protein
MYTKTQIELAFAPWGHNCWCDVFVPTGATGPLPLLICDHGQGELAPSGSQADLAKLEAASGSIPQRITAGTLINPKTNGPYQMIFLCPQASSAQGWAFVEAQLSYILSQFIALSAYNVDQTRIGVTGYSSGGEGAFNCLAADPAFAKKLVMVAPISSAGLTAAEIAGLVPNQAASKLLVFSVCGTADAFFPSNQGYVNTLTAGGASPAPVWTALPGVGHWATSAYDPAFVSANGMSLYDTFLSIGSAVVTPPVVEPPVTPPSVTTTIVAQTTVDTNGLVTFTDTNGKVLATVAGTP